MSKLDASVFSRLFALGTQGDFAAIWCSNQLSNLSNALYSCSASKSNTTSSECPHWSFESSNPLATINTGTLPRFVYNSNNDQTFYIDCKGTAVPLKGYLLSNYDPGCCEWTSNSVALLSNLTSSNGSFLMTLSNLWNLSNVLYNYSAWSNTSTWASNNFSNLSCALWSFEASNPTETSNIGTLPRFVYNSNENSTWYIDCKGNSVPLQGYGATYPANNSVVIAFKTASELAAISNPGVGASYIVTDGAQKGDIATWNGSIWTYYSPSDKETATVTTTSGTYTAGTYTYNLELDQWFFTGSLSLASNTGSPTSPTVSGNFALLSEDDQYVLKLGGPILLVGDQLVTWGDGTPAHSSGDGTSGWSFPRTLPFMYTNLNGTSNAHVATYTPVFVDAAINNYFVLALDSRGKVWGMGIQFAGLGHTPTATSTSNVDFTPYHGLAPISFFHGNPSITIKKVYTAAHQASSTVSNGAALSTTGDLYVTGGNNWGALGLGDVNAGRNGWYKYPITNVKNIKISYGTLLVLTNDNKLYMSGFDGYAVSGTAGNRTTPYLLASNVATFDYGGYQMITLYVVKTDGTLWASGVNTSGQLGIGTQVSQAGLVQVPGITNASSVVADKWDGLVSCILHRDGTISFAGNNSGQFGYQLHTTNTIQKTFVKPNAIFQGIVKKVILGNSTCHLMTTSGEMFNSGAVMERGMGRNTDPGSWAVVNSWARVPLPEAAVGFRVATSATDGANPAYNDGVWVLTTKARIFAYGDACAFRWQSSMGNYAISPVYIPLRNMDHGIKVSSAPA